MTKLSDSGHHMQLEAHLDTPGAQDIIKETLRTAGQQVRADTIAKVRAEMTSHGVVPKTGVQAAANNAVEALWPKKESSLTA